MADDVIILPGIDSIGQVRVDNDHHPKQKAATHDRGSKNQAGAQEKNQPGKKQNDNPEQNFARLSQRIEMLNQKLIENHSPYRFHVYPDQDDVVIDLVILDDQAKVKQTIHKKIDNDQLDQLLEHILTGKGLLLNIIK